MAYDPTLWTTRTDKHLLHESLRVLKAYAKGKPVAFEPFPKHGKACNAHACKCPKIVTARASVWRKLEADIVEASIACDAVNAESIIAALPSHALDRVWHLRTAETRKADRRRYPPVTFSVYPDVDQYAHNLSDTSIFDPAKIPTDRELDDRVSGMDFRHDEWARILEWHHECALREDAERAATKAPPVQRIVRVCGACASGVIVVPVGARVRVEPCASHSGMWSGEEPTVYASAA